MDRLMVDCKDRTCTDCLSQSKKLRKLSLSCLQFPFQIYRICKYLDYEVEKCIAKNIYQLSAYIGCAEDVFFGDTAKQEAEARLKELQKED